MKHDSMQTNSITRERFDWIDQVKGFTIFLVVYGHNFPFNEHYIYSFHMPLFIMIAGFFHPKVSLSGQITTRFRSIMIPYFFWSLLLFLFWFLIGRNYGDSAAMNLSPIKNFIGVFYAQGGRDYMDWAIPLWFLPAIFTTFLIFYWLRKIKNPTVYYSLLILLPLLGLVYSHLTPINLPWSINIALVSLIFYGFGNHFFDKINKLSKQHSMIIMLIAGLINLMSYNFNIKIDTYRAIFGNEFFYILNGLAGSLCFLLFFKTFPVFRFLQFIGKFSLVILALQLFAMTFIKLILLKVFHRSDFNFTEWEKFGYAIVQVLLLVPGFFLINKYAPILNGGYKKI